MKPKSLRTEAGVLAALQDVGERLVAGKTSAHEAATRSRMLRGLLGEIRATAKRERADAAHWQALAERVDKLEAAFAALDKDARR